MSEGRAVSRPYATLRGRERKDVTDEIIDVRAKMVDE